MYTVNWQQLRHYIQIEESFTFLEAFIHGSWKIIPMIIVSYVVGLSIEFGFAVYRGEEVNEGYLVTGLLIPMIMPVDIPLWMVGISTAFAVLAPPATVPLAGVSFSADKFLSVTSVYNIINGKNWWPYGCYSIFKII